MSSPAETQHAPAQAKEPRAASAAEDAALTSRKWLVLSHLLALGWRRPALLAALSAVIGLAEAVMLAIVAQVAAGLATRRNVVDAHLGVGSVHVSIRTLLFAGGALAALRLILFLPVSSLAASITADSQAMMRERLAQTFLRASWAVKSTDREGRFQELMTNQVGAATTGVVQVTYALTYLFSFVVLIVSALLVSPEAAAIVVAACVLLFAVLRPLSRSGSRAAQALSATLLEHAGGVSEATRLAEETQVFGVTSAQNARLQHLIEHARQLFFRTQFNLRIVPNLYQSAVFLLLFGGLALIYAVDRGRLASLGVVVLLLVRAGTYGNMAQNSYQSVKQARPFIERLQAATERYEDAAAPPGSEPFESLEALAFHGVSYSYDARTPTLTDVTFEVSAGETIGVIGPSGAGKSTLAQLLLRLREPDAGQYLVNGVPAHSLHMDDWTRLVAYVPQTPQLIYASVADNIGYYRDVPRTEIQRAAELAGIHDDIVRWSDGYDTIVGPRAAAVSVGQAQRICLARALVLRPKVLVLDEPTSALDPTSERLIQASLTALRGSLTLFVIAHRLSTLDICDRVIVLVDGRLDAVEAFDELELRNAYYRSAKHGVA
ncbi:MAG TPA: ABC transporter ATP-binding protein [Gaiellaceae bacterium]|nr:ABC transporter ATP-binding protein [Gaiellaceae bacterium]